MRISDWSSDVCSSDLAVRPRASGVRKRLFRPAVRARDRTRAPAPSVRTESEGRADLHRRAEGEGTGLRHRLLLRWLGRVADGADQPRSRGGLRLFLQHGADRSEEHTSELQTLLRISYAV